MSSNHARATRWAKRITDPSLRELAARGSVFAQGDTIYSYGTHFPMATVYRDNKGRARFVLVNGDTYSVTTSGHQSMVRGVIRKHAPDVPMAIIPRTALRAANIDAASIVALDVKPDGWEYHRHVADAPPKSAVTVDAGSVYRGERFIGATMPEDGTVGRWCEAEDIPAGAVAREGTRHGASGWYDVPADPAEYMGGTGNVLAVTDERGNPQIIERDERGRYVWHTAQHWLGECLFAARQHGQRRRTKYLSGFDRNERERLYFLCELPATAATDIDGAIEALKPDTVRMAEAMGRECERQGDIFAVPMPGLTWATLKAQGGTLARRSDARKGDVAQARYSALYERLVQAEDVRFTTPEYLMHRAIMRISVFGNVSTWKAREHGLREARPLIPRWGKRSPFEADTRARIDATVRHRRDYWRDRLQARADAALAASADPAGISLLGTAHTATQVVTMPDGTQYAKGTMYHDPRLMGENRERDHARRKMGDGKTWHLIQKNTVPVQNRSGRRTPASM